MTGRPSALATDHGELQLPAFLPDATRGVVRAAGVEDLRAAGVAGLVVNTLHLAQEPGSSVVEALGGIHRFMGWSGPVLSDSGGFQVFSLAAAGKGRVRVTRDGLDYRLAAGGERRTLSPEKCLQLQFRLGADIVVALDHFTDPEAGPEGRRESVENTVTWAARGKEEWARHSERTGRRPLLFAVVQGGNDPELRRECAERLVSIGFDGYGFGGRPVDDGGNLVPAVEQVAGLVPLGAPLWGLGIGKPEHLSRAHGFGYRLFDCVLPTRDARHRRLYAFSDGRGEDAAWEYVYLQDERHVRDGRPVDPSCDAACCRHSRAYLHHLFAIDDALAPRLATLHNLRFYARLLARIRL